MKIFLCINVLQAIKAQAYIAHMHLVYKSKELYPESKFYLFTPERMSIDRARNTAARMALELECDYLWFLDDDVLPEPHTLRSFLNADKDIIAAETYIRGYPFDAMHFIERPNGDLTGFNEFRNFVGEDGLCRVDAVGFSCALIKCSLLKQITLPYFITGENFTEDVYFCNKAQQQLGKENVSIYIDTKVPTGHLLNSVPVHRSNVDLLRKFYELQDYGFKNPDRGKEYMEMVENSFKSNQGVLEFE